MVRGDAFMTDLLSQERRSLDREMASMTLIRDWLLNHTHWQATVKRTRSRIVAQVQPEGLHQTAGSAALRCPCDPAPRGLALFQSQNECLEARVSTDRVHVDIDVQVETDP